MVKIILAAGDQQRWQESGGKGFKQLVDIGEPLLKRTLRQFNGYLVTKDLQEYHDKIIVPSINDCLASSLLSSRYHWSGMVTVLLGDVYYSDRLAELIENTSETMFFGNERDIFAFKFLSSNYVIHSIEVAQRKRGKLWDVYRAYIYPKKFTDFPYFVKINDETQDFDILEDYERFIANRKPL